MAETKKKPTLRKAPKGSLKETGDGAASAKGAAQDVRALEQHEKAAAKKAVRDANEASKERKRQAKQDEKAAKAEAKAAAKKERAERKAQEKAARAEARERDKAKRLARKTGAPEDGASAETEATAAAPENATASPASDEAESPEESFAASLERDLEDASAYLAGIGGAGKDAPGEGAGASEADGAPAREGASKPDVRFVSGDDAYDLPAPDRRGAARSAGRARGARRRIPVGRIVLVVVLVLVIAAVVAAGLFSWNRWWRFDDAADFQGTWQYGDTPYQVTIDGTTMTLSKDAAYDYELDTFQKAVTFHFGDLKGHGCYAFSEDRSTLVIVDGRTPDVGTMLGFTDVTENAGVENDGTSTVIVLKRVGAASAEQAAPQPAPPASDASQPEAQDTPSSDEGTASGAGEEATDSATEDAASDEGSDGPPSGGEVDNLGNDPGEDTGSNVVTPEDLGIALTEEE